MRFSLLIHSYHNYKKSIEKKVKEEKEGKEKYRFWYTLEYKCKTNKSRNSAEKEEREKEWLKKGGKEMMIGKKPKGKSEGGKGRKREKE